MEQSRAQVFNDPVVGASRRRGRHVAVVLAIVATQLAATVSLADGPLWDPEDFFGADYPGKCGYDKGTSDEFTSCVTMQNNIWFAGRPASFGNQWPGIDAKVQGSLSGDYNPTDLVAYWTTTDTYPDVWFWDWTWTNMPFGTAGRVDCPASNTGVARHAPDYYESRWCRGQIIRFNWTGVLNYASLGLVDINGSGVGLPLWQFSEFVACHELGHTVGLRDIDGGPTYPTCMNYRSSGLPGGLSDYWAPYLNSGYNREVDEINDHY